MIPLARKPLDVKTERKEIMSDLRVKPNTDNGDLDGQENWTDNVSADSDEFRIQLADIFEPTKLREWFEKVDGQGNKDKEKA